MSTQTLSPGLVRQRRVSDGRFYLAMALLSTLLIFVGFSRSYYLKFHYPLSPKLSVLVHVHGLVFSLWMVYFVLQTALIAVRRPRLHRNLGLLGVGLATAMVVLGLLVAWTGERLHHGGVGQDAEVIFLVGLIDLFSFLLFFVAGWVWRRNREAHQRLMLLTVVVGLSGPALGRLAGAGIPLPLIAGVNLLLLFAGPVYDFVTRRRVHPVYVWGVVWALVTFTPIRFAVGATAWWHHVARVLAGMPG